MIKAMLIRILPQKLKKLIKLIFNFPAILTNYSYNGLRYLKYSNTVSSLSDFKKLEAHIIAHVHSIERGLSLKEMRLGFGLSLLDSLIALLDRYLKTGYDPNKWAFVLAISALESYISIHEPSNYDMSLLKQRVENFKKLINKPLIKAGYAEISNHDVLEASKQEFPVFSRWRYSIRNFTEEDVDIETIKEAIKIAQKSPSVCNRQSVRIYIIKNKKIMKDILNIHNGVDGFQHLVNTILIVTSDLSTFFGINERNQCYIDGGIFLMSLLYSLHYMGLGVCTLNWCMEKKKDLQLRKISTIESSENIIALIAVGHLPSKIKVAVSQRRDLNEITTVI